MTVETASSVRESSLPGRSAPAAVDNAFPILTPAQISRVAAHGTTHTVSAGEMLAIAGAINLRFFVVVSGEIHVVRSASDTETLVTAHTPGKFSGEANMLSGRPSLVSIRVEKPGEVIELSRDRLLQLIQTDDELGKIFLRAFILRRLLLIDNSVSDVVLVGSDHSQGTLRIREFLTRNGHPYTNLDLDRDKDAQELLDRVKFRTSDVPVLIRGNG